MYEDIPKADDNDILLLVRTCKIWCIALRKHLEKQQAEQIHEIPAAKFMRLISKIWNSYNKDDPESFFKMPVILDSGAKFGRRVRSPYSHPNDPKCDIDIVEQFLGEQGINQGIRFHYESDKDSLSRGLKVEPLLSDVDAEVLIKQGKITRKSYQCLNEMCAITAEFTDDELTAIGRHEDPEKLREDINQEAEWLAEKHQELIEACKRIKFTDGIIRGPKTEIHRIAYDIRIFGSEMKKKAYSEKALYKSAMNKIKKKQTDYPMLVNKIFNEQKSVTEIWENERVSSLVFISFVCATYSKIVSAVIEDYLLPCFSVERKKAIHKQDFDTAYNELNTLFKIDPEFLPIEFNYKSLEKLKSENRLPFITFSKFTDMLCQKEDLDLFIKELNKVFDFIKSKYLEPRCFIVPKNRPCYYQLKLFEKKH